MINKGFKIFTIFGLIILLSVSSFAQYKSQVEELPTLEKAIQFPGSNNSNGLNLLDPNRFFMNQSYSLSMGFGQTGTGSMGMYMNNMSYILTSDLIVNARLGFVHNPLQMGNTMTGNLGQNLIYGADILYKPTENMRLKLSFDKRPYTYNPYMSPYRYPGIY